ncbi:multidrug transporter [Bhargavaea cecembensis]|uniref:Multidrug transporter n=1 Tax=Bhargavaea cecembensis TaxID=394098 RepID=A0A161RBK3_9BACL|nr:DMT family transporter [Bhargavaea cecembensis]KZE36822.1 multidrug transporter [Bhargavaea cecembensis]
MPKWIYPVMIAVGSSCYGILSTNIKLAMNAGFTASEAVTAQYMTGFFLALLLFAAINRRLPNLKGASALIPAGVFTAATGIVYGKSLVYLPASLAVVLLFQFTWIGMLIDCIARKRLPNRAEVFSLVLLFMGTVLAAGLIGTDLTGIPWQGWAWGMAAALTFSLFIFSNRKTVEGMDTLTRMLITSFIAVIVISAFQSPEILWDGSLQEGLWMYGLLLGVFGIIAPIALFGIAVPHVGSGLSSILSSAELPVAVTVSVLLLHEPFSGIQLAGIIVILVGMVLPTLFEHRRRSAPPVTESS